MMILMMVNGKKVNQKVEVFINPKMVVYMIKKEIEVHLRYEVSATLRCPFERFTI